MHTAQTENSREYPGPEKGGVVEIRLHLALKFVYITLEPQKLAAVGVCLWRHCDQHIRVVQETKNTLFTLLKEY